MRTPPPPPSSPHPPRTVPMHLLSLPPPPSPPFRGAHGAVIVYDITCPKSFLRAKFWVGELQRSGTDSLGEGGWVWGGIGSLD